MSEYLFDTGSELGHHHLDQLGKLLDAPTTWRLRTLGLRPDLRCLELGAGSGSIANWLAARTREVVAVDIDTTQLQDVAPGVQVHRHDLRDGLPVDGPFDLIHARLLLLHLPERGTGGCLLHHNLNEQAEPLLLAAGATPAELTRYRALMLDPRFRAWFYELLYTNARKPA
ncbi:methyltransferase domain-containing protein [Kribbella sp. NPDC048915]|uniref:class I SAM-dependent methyltransferase n=1 Tax=Kribbella sp. NPDC048915 TaxID=3155148 RepID=UPI00340BA841